MPVVAVVGLLLVAVLVVLRDGVSGNEGIGTEEEEEAPVPKSDFIGVTTAAVAEAAVDVVVDDLKRLPPPESNAAVTDGDAPAVLLLLFILVLLLLLLVVRNVLDAAKEEDF